MRAIIMISLALILSACGDINPSDAKVQLGSGQVWESQYFMDDDTGRATKESWEFTDSNVTIKRYAVDATHPNYAPLLVDTTVYPWSQDGSRIFLSGLGTIEIAVLYDISFIVSRYPMRNYSQTIQFIRK